MNICFDGLKTGTVCLGDVMSRLHGEELGITHAGLGILALIAVAIAIFVFRSPA